MATKKTATKTVTKTASKKEAAKKKVVKKKPAKSEPFEYESYDDCGEYTTLYQDTISYKPSRMAYLKVSWLYLKLFIKSLFTR